MKEISKFMKRSAYHLGMFFWVRALLVNMPALSIEDAVKNFMSNNKIVDGEDENAQSLVREFHRIRKEYYEEEKTKKDV